MHATTVMAGLRVVSVTSTYMKQLYSIGEGGLPALRREFGSWSASSSHTAMMESVYWPILNPARFIEVHGLATYRPILIFALAALNLE